GAAVSPGARICNFAKTPALTVVDGLVLGVLLPLLLSVAVTVELPAVLKVTLKVLEPPLRSALAGKVAFASLEVMLMLSRLLTRFQLASTALTRTLKAVPAACAVGVPVLPVALPAAAVSPGMSSCNLVKDPALTVTEELTPGFLVPSVLSLAVTVKLPAVLGVTLNVFVPATNAAAPGAVAFVSLNPIPAVSVTVLMRFQLASTAFTVMVKAVPAVWAVGVPVLPVEVPGAAVSPGSKTCNWLNGPALTTILPEVADVRAPLVN